MSNNEKVIKNYIYNTAYQVLVLIAPLITTPYVSRVLGADGVGIYSYTQSIATYFVLIGSVGTSLYGQREIAYVQDNPEERTRIFWEISCFRFVTVFLCAIVYFLTWGSGEQYQIIYRILTLEILATAFDISWFFMGMENFKVTVIRNTIVKLIGIVLIFIFVKSSEDVPLYTLCLTLPIFLGNISLWFKLPCYLVKFKWQYSYGIKRHIKPILILFIPQVATQVYLLLDKTMIGLLATGMDEVGYYTQAQKIIQIVLTLVTSLGTVMLPAMSFAFSQGKVEEIRKSIVKAFDFVFLAGFAMLFGVVAISSKFVPWFFGKGFDKVIPIMVIISPIIIIIGISNVIGKQYLLPTKQQSVYTFSVASGAVVNLILNFILIRFLNSIGASIATVFAELSVMGVQVYHVRNQLPICKCFSHFFKYLLCGLGMFWVVYLIGRFLPEGSVSLGIMVIVGAFVYILELIVTKDKMFEIGWDMIKKKIKKV